MFVAKHYILACAIVATVIYAQSSNIGACCNIDPESVNVATRIVWCRAQIAICTTLCGPTTSNTCDANTLGFSCKCQNGLEPPMANYRNSISTYMCVQWKSRCITAANNDLAAQEVCNAQTCGDKEAARLADSSTALSSDSSTAIETSIFRSSSPTQVNLPTSATLTASTSKTRATSDGLLSSSPTTGSATGLNSPNGSSSLPPGAIAGIVIGVVLGIGLVLALLWFYRRRRRSKSVKRTADLAGESHNDEKLVIIPTVSEIPLKPELHSNSTIIPSTLPQVVDEGHGLGPEHPVSTELPSSPNQPPLELSASQRHHSNEPQRQTYSHPVELRSSTPHRELDGTAPVVAPTLLHSFHQSLPSQHEPPSQELSQNAIASSDEYRDADPKLPTLTTCSTQPLSPEVIAALEEEERRIDAEIEEVQRMKQLREQKFAVQQKLREAKR